MQPSGASGADMAGNLFTIAGSKATGNAAAGSIMFQTSVVGASGSTLQSLTDRAIVHGTGVVGIGKFSAFTATRLEIVDDSIAGSPIVNITSSSTGAASNLQKGINVSLSGANVTASQATYAYFSANTHTGAGTNYGASFSASGGASNIGVQGIGTSIGVDGSGGSIGVKGQGTATAVWAIASGSGNGMQSNSVDGYTFAGIRESSTTNTVITTLLLDRQTTGTGADGIGSAIEFNLESSTSQSQISNEIISKFTTATHASRTSALVLRGVFNAAVVDLLTLAGDGSAKLRGITATEASAITAADGMLIYVNSTNGTFTAVGFWGRESGVWVKM